MEVNTAEIALAEETTTTTTPLKTEDTGKIFEKAICDAYGIPYDGPFQYSQADVDKLTPRLKRLVTDNLFPMCAHTASKGARYDFTTHRSDNPLDALLCDGVACIKLVVRIGSVFSSILVRRHSGLFYNTGMCLLRLNFIHTSESIIQLRYARGIFTPRTDWILFTWVAL